MKKRLDLERVRKLLNEGLNFGQIAMRMGVRRDSLYSFLRRNKVQLTEKELQMFDKVKFDR